jgi:hypothetical protein
LAQGQGGEDGAQGGGGVRGGRLPRRPLGGARIRRGGHPRQGASPSPRSPLLLRRPGLRCRRCYPVPFRSVLEYSKAMALPLAPSGRSRSLLSAGVLGGGAVEDWARPCAGELSPPPRN